MKKHLSLAVILTFILALVSVIYSVNHNSKITNKPEPVITENVSATEDEAQMRGLWVSYISLDMSDTDFSENAFRDKFGEIIKTAKEYRCNALFVHTRAFCDAFYKSEIFPSSHILWGEQGYEESYDALEIMCSLCEKENIELHAWVNPYRVKSKGAKFELSSHNPYVLDKSLGVEYDGGIYLNPAKKEVRNLIVNGVLEIIENYNINGIHFDDYFYPTNDESFDKAEYNQYLKACKSESDAMPLNEWRKQNVNMLIAEIYRKIKETNPSISFGISPQGNIQNDFEMGADVKSWTENIGYADYICPQLYYSIENPALKFEAGLDSWLSFSRHENLKLYAGLAVYKAGTDSDDGTWLLNNDILATELKIINNKGLDGYILYDYEALISEKAKEEMCAFKESLD